jgi:glycosyltransferase involved in cell wall biosynthesis
MQEFSPDVGGWGYHLFSELSKKMDVVVLARPYKHSIKIANKVEIINSHFKIIRYAGREIRGIIFPTDLKYILTIEKTPTSLIQMDEFFKIYTIQAAKWCKQNNVPYIISSRMRPRPGRLRNIALNLFKWFSKDAVRNAKKIIATQGKISQDEFRVWFPSKKESDFVIIPSGININSFVNNNKILPIKKNIILAVSRIYPIKRLDLMLRILKRLDKGELWIVGKEDKTELMKLKKMIITLGLQKRVKFFGGIENKKLPKVYASAKVFVNTSETEGICFSFLEAMAFKLPIVAWDVGGNSGVIENGLTGFLAKFGDMNSMASYIDYLLDDNEIFRNKMGEEAYLKLQEEFDIKKNAQKLLNVYKEIL